MARNLPNRLNEEPKSDAEKTSDEAVVAPITDDMIGISPIAIRPRAAAPKVKVQQFRVRRGPQPDGSWKVVFDGAMTRLASGKVIDERTYNIARLRALGVELDELEAKEV